MADSPNSNRPPKPRLTLRVGITGHRPNKLGNDAVARVERQLALVFKSIEGTARNILDANKAVYSSAEPMIRLTCGFAEGADLLAVKICPQAWQIEAVLPFPQKEYLEDFQKSASGDGRDVSSAFHEGLKRAATITELPGSRPDERDRSYADAGGYLLRQVDMLIAVWDGQPPKPGGTGALARKALDGGIPVLWLATHEDRVPRLITAFDEAGAPVAPDVDCTDGSLENALRPIFAAPASGHGHEDPRETSRPGLERYLGEFWRHNTYWTAFDLLKRLATKHWPRWRIHTEHPDKRTGEWKAFLDEAPAVENLRRRLESILLPRFIWADELAVHFSHRYRSVYVLAYLLSAAAVMIALAGIFFEHSEDVLRIKVAFVVVELLVIGFILGMVLVGRYWHWHERWLHYRTLAENLRHARFLAYVSEFGGIHVPTADPEDREPSWVLWYIRATLREIGLPTAVLNGTYQWKVLNATLIHEIEGQLGWHKDNVKASRRLDQVLHDVGIGCFLLTFVFLVAFLALFLTVYGVEYLWHAPASTVSHDPTMLGTFLLLFKPFVTFAAAGLPALGAALAGIRVQGDFEGSRERSDHMEEILSKRADEFRMAESRPLALDETAQMLISIAQDMSEDVAAWQELYGRKRLTLPA
jgi:hypothetical protein